MDTRNGLDGCGKSRHHRDSILGPSSPWRVAIPTELSMPQIETKPFNNITYITMGTAVALWLKYCATNQKVDPRWCHRIFH
jgi:hypothetical protein